MSSIQSQIKAWQKAAKVKNLIQSVILKTKIKNKIIQLNQNQLDKGKDRNDKQIRTYKAIQENLGYVYAKNTIFGTKTYEGKKEKGQDWRHVTLKDEGDFRRDKFQVRAALDAFFVFPTNLFKPAKINSKGYKSEGGFIDENLDLTDVFNLNKTNTNELIRNWILPELIDEMRKELNL